MFFNSINFALFLPIVLFLYWFISKGKLKIQNVILLFSSYFFYACWDYRFLLLLIFSTFLDYFTGIRINEAINEKSRKFWFWLSIGVNLGFLGVFKYYNFFAESLKEALSVVGFKAEFWTLNIILPVGISFYTFHGLSYVIDIYKKRIKAERNFIDYSVFVSFFPLLVAGPIERATHLLPQIKKDRIFDYSKAIEGLQQILWGLFKKVVIADSCADYSNLIFNNINDYKGTTLILGAVFFSVQIYCDFSGYSDIALGTAKLFGIDLLRNFAYPYFSRDIAEFWRRWHISLSSWFKDYLYIPLGGSRGTIFKTIRNTLIIFIVSGFWHGANWTFIIWGLLHAIYIIPSIVLNKNRIHLNSVSAGKIIPSIGEMLSMLFTFSLVVFAWIFFRSPSVYEAFHYIRSMISGLFSLQVYQNTFGFIINEIGVLLLFLIFILFAMEWLGREFSNPLTYLSKKVPKTVIHLIYYCLLFLIVVYFGNDQQFIYFQF